MNRGQAEEVGGIAKEVARALLATNGADAASAIRVLSDEQLDRAEPQLSPPGWHPCRAWPLESIDSRRVDGP